MVQIATRPPASPPSDDHDTFGKRHRRRWLWWLLAGFLVIVVGATSTGIILAANYQPFVPGYKQYYGQPAVEGTQSTSFRWNGAPPNLRVVEVPTKPGLTFRYRFSIWNHGPVPITVTSLGIPASEQESDLKQVPVAVYPNVYNVPEIGGRWIPVQSVRLAPRQMMGIEMEVSVSRCMSGVSWNEIPITFQMYGITRHALAPTNVQIDLVGSATC